MYYYLYEIKNKLNGMVYVGIHKTKNIDDGYMGSGKAIINAIKKHGIENFEKIILANFDDEESMRLAEELYVNDDFLARSDVYNIVNGGGCGWKYVNELYPNKPKTEEHRKKISDSLLENYPESTRIAVSKAASKPKSDEQKKKSSNFYDDKILIWHELIGKKWAKEENLVNYLDQGWFLGKSPKMMKPKKSKDDKLKPGRKPPDAATIEKYNTWHDLYKDVGFAKFCELTGYASSSPNLIQLFNRYVSNFKPSPGNHVRR